MDIGPDLLPSPAVLPIANPVGANSVGAGQGGNGSLRSAETGWGRRDALICALCLALVALPLCITGTLPLVDYHNHLMRFAFLADRAHHQALLDYLTVEWNFNAALAMDVLVPPLIPLIGVEPAGRVFIMLTFAVLVSGAVYLNRGLNRDHNVLPYLSFLLLYNTVFLWGFLNYLFGIGVCLWIFGAWVRYRSSPPMFVLPLFSLAGFVLVASHLYGFGMFGILVATYELTLHVRAQGRRWFIPTRPLMLGASIFVVPIILFFALNSTGGLAAESGDYDLKMKLSGLLSIFHLYNRYVDAAVIAGIAGIAAFGWWRGWLLGGVTALPILAVLGVTWAIMPNRLFDSVFSDYRLPVAIAFVLVGVGKLDLTAKWQRLILHIGLPVLLAAQIGWIAERWHGFDKIYATFFQAADEIDPGSRLLVAIAQPSPGYDLLSPPFTYIGMREMIRRYAFVNGIFVVPTDTSVVALREPYAWLQYLPTWRPVYFQDALDAMAAEPRDHLSDPFNEKLLAAYDYLLVVREDKFPYGVPVGTPRLFDKAGFRLYDLRHR